MMSPTKVILILLNIPNIYSAIIGVPEVKCNSSAVRIQMEMDNPFSGHIFLRGQYGNHDCHRNFTFDEVTEPAVDFEFEKCKMRRKRETNPRGLSFSGVLVVAHHDKLITYKDMAYNLDCFFIEQRSKVELDVKVEDPKPTQVMAHPALPKCEYTLTSAQKGDILRSATVGDSVIHSWKCGSPTHNDIHCLRVHSCVVMDDGERNYEVVDAEGCPTDPEILSPLSYTSDLSAIASSRVFKIADKPDLMINCQVQLFFKNEHNGTCPSPQCGSSRRLRRALSSSFNVNTQRGQNFDVDSQRVTVIEKDNGMLVERSLADSFPGRPRLLEKCPLATPALLSLAVAFLIYFTFTMCFILQKNRRYSTELL